MAANTSPERENFLAEQTVAANTPPEALRRVSARRATGKQTMAANTSSKGENFLANLRADYEQTNGQIRMLTDIRFKLLTLIPTGTVVAVSVLGTTVSTETALVVGILGFVFVFAIAMYDLRNSQIYDAYLSRAMQLENQLRMPNGGLYNRRPGRDVKLFGVLVWHDRALAFIYGTTLGGWVYLITYSSLNLTYFLLNLNATDPKSVPYKYNILFYLASTIISILAACAFIWHFHQIEATRTGQRKLTIYGISKRQGPKGHDIVTIDLSLKNSWIHAFRYNVSELKLRDKDGEKHTNVSSSKQDYITKGKLKSKGAHGSPSFWRKIVRLIAPSYKMSEPWEKRGFIDYKLPEGSKPEALALVYTPRLRFLNVQQIKYFTKNIVLIRHGEKAFHPRHPQHKDKDIPLSSQEVAFGEGQKKFSQHKDEVIPLSSQGEEEVRRLKRLLTRLDLDPEIYLTSPYAHAQETAKLLAGEKQPVYPVAVLAPAATTGENIFQTIIDQAEQEAKKKLELDWKTTIAIVGHEPELLNILEALTSSRIQSINYGEAVWVRGYPLSDFREGKGVIQDQISGDNGSGGRGGQEGGEGSF